MKVNMERNVEETLEQIMVHGPSPIWESGFMEDTNATRTEFIGSGWKIQDLKPD